VPSDLLVDFQRLAAPDQVGAEAQGGGDHRINLAEPCEPECQSCAQVTATTAVAAPAAPENAAPPPGFNTYRETSANDAKRMFVCATSRR
jgi:hypothetical protein